MFHRRGGKKNSEKVLSHHLSWVVGFFFFLTLLSWRYAEMQKKREEMHI